MQVTYHHWVLQWLIYHWIPLGNDQNLQTFCSILDYDILWVSIPGCHDDIIRCFLLTYYQVGLSQIVGELYWDPDFKAFTGHDGMD